MEEFLKDIQKHFPNLNFEEVHDFYVAETKFFYYEFSFENNSIFWLLIRIKNSDKDIIDIFFESASSIQSLKEKWQKTMKEFQSDYLGAFND